MYLTTLIILFFGICACHNTEKQESLELEELTIGDIHKAFVSGTYTSHDLVDAYIAAIGNSDVKINAITLINPNALSIAQALDEEFLETKELRPLHGIPIIVKDNINTAGE